MKNYQATIGLEIHAELKTRSKMFCTCANAQTRKATDNDTNGHEMKPQEPNINICPVCLGMPGVLPVLNRQAIDWTIMTGLALNCKISSTTKWDRKNYFYPDLPKGYQISQYDLPICWGGYLEVTNSCKELQGVTKSYNKNVTFGNQSQLLATNRNRRIRITRIHLEEDTGTLKHPEGRTEVDYSLADYNRAGVPLMELVTEPDIRSAEEAKKFCQDYQQILRALKIADADMEKGQLRCEVNISLRRNPKSEILNSKQIQNSKFQKSKLGTKVEIKNLNSFKAVQKAIEYEIERQIGALESGGKIIQETRGWDDRKNKTYIMRVKETSADYRYFPEPDLPPVKISKDEIEKLKKELPELPEQRAERYVEEFNLKKDEALIIASNLEKAEFFEKGIQYTRYSKDLGTWIVNDPFLMEIGPKNAGKMNDLKKEGKISSTTAKSIFPELKKGKTPEEIIREKGLTQISDSKDLQKIVDRIIKENPQVVESVKKGKFQAIGFLVGQIMKETKGQANPQIINKLIKEKLIVTNK